MVSTLSKGVDATVSKGMFDSRSPWEGVGRDVGGGGEEYDNSGTESWQMVCTQ